MIKNILLVDDHGIFLDGLQAVIHEKKNLRVKAMALSAETALQWLKDEQFHLMIADYCMPDMDGVELISRARRIAPAMKIIVLSMIEDREDIRNMLAYGIDAYVLKKYARQELFQAIDAALAGDTYWSPEVCSAVVNVHRENATQSPLTAREREVLQLLAGELTSKEIAGRLFISERTVESHRKNLLRKTGSANVAGLIKYAYSRKLL